MLMKPHFLYILLLHAVNCSNTPVSLDIKRKRTTVSHFYELNEGIATFKGKITFCFNEVKSRDTVIWRMEELCAKLVIVYGIGSSNKVLTIHFPDGTKLIFERNGKGKHWKNTTPLITNVIKLMTTDKGGNITEMISPQYKIIKDNGSETKYKINCDCSEVKCDDTLIWKHEEENDRPHSITYDKSTIKITLHFETKSVTFSCNENWKGVVSSSAGIEVPLGIKICRITDGKKVIVDQPMLKSKRLNDGYYYSEPNFTELTCKGQQVWKHKGGDLPISFSYKNDGTLTIYFVYGYLTYTEKEDGWNITK